MIINLLVAFGFSFVGSIPPGSINLSVIQLSMQGKIAAAFRFCLAAALIEFPYGYIAVIFESYITSSPIIVNNFRLITGITMIALGILNILPDRKKSEQLRKFKESGFRKGVLISILNPLAIPFWVGVTAYLKHQGWIEVDSTIKIIFYVLGISLGTFSLLAVLALIAKRLGNFADKGNILKLVPGIVFFLLGGYALLQYFQVI